MSNQSEQIGELLAKLQPGGSSVRKVAASALHKIGSDQS